MARYDYTTVGHVTVDIGPEGGARPGGTAFYSALQAARLGQRTLIITQGRPDEIEQMIDPFAGELDLRVVAADHTTALQTVADGEPGAQRMVTWAGPISAGLAVDTSILHLAPIARETPRQWRGRSTLVGVTAQGLVRSWEGDGGVIVHTDLDRRLLPDRCDAIVISEHERDSASGLFGGAARGLGALVVVTAGSEATAIHTPTGQVEQVEVPAVDSVGDDVGAGDVFAAALFVELARGRTPLQAVAFANAAAGVRISGRGAAAIGDRSAIESRLSSA